MPNRYAATCYRCGKTIPPGEGVLERTGFSQRKKWGVPLPKYLVQHHDCATKYRGTTIHYRFNPDNKESDKVVTDL